MSSGLSCSICNKPFNADNVAQLPEHRRLRHRKDDVAVTESELTEVKWGNNGSGRFRCPICKICTSQEYLLSVHVALVHTNSFEAADPDIKCNFCESSPASGNPVRYESLNALHRHVEESHSGGAKAILESLGKFLGLGANDNNGDQGTTMESKPVPSNVLRERQVMPCKFDPKSGCSFYGFDKLSLMAHIEVVHREKKPMRCEVSRECGFEAGTTLTLKQHEKICPMKNSS